MEMTLYKDERKLLTSSRIFPNRICNLRTLEIGECPRDRRVAHLCVYPVSICLTAYGRVRRHQIFLNREM